MFSGVAVLQAETQCGQRDHADLRDRGDPGRGGADRSAGRHDRIHRPDEDQTAGDRVARPDPQAHAALFDQPARQRRGVLLRGGGGRGEHREEERRPCASRARLARVAPGEGGVQPEGAGGVRSRHGHCRTRPEECGEAGRVFARTRRDRGQPGHRERIRTFGRQQGPAAFAVAPRQAH